MLNGYVNHGGIGMVGAEQGLPLVPSEYRMSDLIVFAQAGGTRLVKEKAPTDGWSGESVAKALESRRATILSFAPADAYLGPFWLGSTEA